MNTMSYAKAVQYAKYRLPYSAEAVSFVIEQYECGQKYTTICSKVE
ncbi:hypothetical protein [Paenibacillus sp. HW567]|nr:hypothetical protein [Paenibacillus sp. HW567]